jgi:thioesterase domain-containing protein
LSVCQANLQAIEHYVQVQNPDVPVTLYRATDPAGRSHPVEAHAEADLGWSALLGRPIEVLDSEGNHVSMLTGDRVTKLSHAVRESIDASVQRETATSD